MQVPDAHARTGDDGALPHRLDRAFRLQHALLVLALVAVTLRIVAQAVPAQTAATPIAPIDAIAGSREARRSPPPLVPGTPQFGLNTHLMWDGPAQAAVDLDRIVAAGQTVVRFDVQWDGFEPTEKGGWDDGFLARLDQTLDLVEQRGLRPILVVVGTPAWARGGLGSRFTPPDRAEDFADAVGYLAARYQDRPSIAYEIWNEPNQDDFWDTHAGPDPVVYGRLLQAAYARIKAAAPDATVLGGSIAFNDRDYFEQMYQAGDVSQWFDALALHPYSLGNAPEQVDDQIHSFALAVDSMRTVMAEHGSPNKPIWITEMGWSTTVVSDATRATYFQQAVQLVRGWPQVVAFCAYQLSQDQGESAVAR